MMIAKIRNTISLFTSVALAACAPVHTVSSEYSGPAVLVSADEQTLSILKSALRQHMGKTSVKFGSGDFLTSPEFSVLPPPASSYDTHSLARPSLFELQLRDGKCSIYDQASDTFIPLEGISCRPFSP